MKPQKLDRFERAATRAAYRLIWDKEHPDGGELQLAISKELRNEHAWMRRTLKGYIKRNLDAGRESVINGDSPFIFDMKREAAEEILALLAQRRK